jgi:hypothetical protein
MLRSTLFGSHALSLVAVIRPCAVITLAGVSSWLSNDYMQDRSRCFWLMMGCLLTLIADLSLCKS